MPEGRFTTSKLLSEITDSGDFDNEKHPSLFNLITLSGIGRIVLHPLLKAQTAKIPLELGAKLDLQVHFRREPSIDEMGTLSREIHDLFAENELGITGTVFVGLKVAVPCPDSPSTEQEMNDHASNGSKADDMIDDDVAVDIKLSTPRLPNQQQ